MLDNTPTMLRIDRAELRLVRLPLKFRFETSFGAATSRYFALLTLQGGGIEGYAETVSDDFYPLYREETVATSVAILRNVLLPRVMGKTFASPEAVGAAFAPFRGNRMAKAVVEMAFWDMWARSLNQPLSRLLGGSRDAVPVGVSLGIQPSAEATVDIVGKHVAQGYKRIKLKIKPGWEVTPVAAVRQRFPDINLTVDANSAFTYADLKVFKKLDAYGLDYIEQPLAYDDIFDHAKLQAQIQTALCLDESILSAADTRKALEHRAGRVINIKVGRVGGHAEARRVHDVAAAFDAPVWCGGMLESGIGRAHNIHLATLPNFTKPGDTSSASRYWDADIVNEPLETVDGMMPVPAGAGIGVTLNRPVLEKLTESVEVFAP